MKAIAHDAYGPPSMLRLREVEKPVAVADQVLVRVRAAGVDPGVWHLTAGLPYMVRLMGLGLRAPKTHVQGTDSRARSKRSARPSRGFRPARRSSAPALTTARAPSPSTPSARQSGSRSSRPTSASSRRRRCPSPPARRSRGSAIAARSSQGQTSRSSSGPAAAWGRTRAARQGVRRRGDRRVQHRQGGPRPVARRRRRDRLHPRGLRGRTRRYDLIVDCGGRRALAALRRALAPRRQTRSRQGRPCAMQRTSACAGSTSTAASSSRPTGELQTHAPDEGHTQEPGPRVTCERRARQGPGRSATSHLILSRRPPKRSALEQAHPAGKVGLTVESR